MLYLLYNNTYFYPIYTLSIKKKFIFFSYFLNKKNNILTTN